MKLTAIVIAALLLAACASPSANTNKTVKFTKKFAGKLSNKYPVEMILERNGNSLSGTYYHTEGDRNECSVTGTVDAQGNFTMDDFHANGTKLGTFTGKFTTPDSIEGEWTSSLQPDNIRPISLRTAGLADSVPVAKATPGQSMDEQAIAEVRKVFEDTAFTKCDESYFSMDSALGATYGGGMATGIAQRRNPRYEVETTYPITEADKLNEITWKGTVILKFDAIRHYKNGSWVDWRPYQPLKMYELTINKRGSKWVTDTPYILNHAQSKVSCSEVPH